jgi:hypothetical protein
VSIYDVGRSELKVGVWLWKNEQAATTSEWLVVTRRGGDDGGEVEVEEQKRGRSGDREKGGGRLLTCTWLNSQRSRGDQTRPDRHTQDTGR